MAIKISRGKTLPIGVDLGTSAVKLVQLRLMEETTELLAVGCSDIPRPVRNDPPRRLEFLAERIRHAGAMFLGAWSSESLGDYCAGPNHVLPTMRTARFSSPLGVYDFQKRSSLIEVSQAGAQTLGPIAATLAHGEGLTAHARAAELRIKR